MTQDEKDRPRSTAPRRPDAAFIQRLEDDSLWQESPRPVRRTDRYAEKRGDRQNPRTRRVDDQGYARRPVSKRTPPRSRRIALIVLVVVIVVLVVAGLELSDSTASSESTPFSLLPLDSDVVTTTATDAAQPTTTVPVESTTTTSGP
jgi:hypothetical protein